MGFVKEAAGLMQEWAQSNSTVWAMQGGSTQTTMVYFCPEG